MVIRTKEQWLSLFQQQKESGLNATAFCKKNNLCPKYFSKRKSDFNWKGKTKSLSKQMPKLVKVESFKSKSNDTTFAIYIRTQGIELTVPAEQSAQWVADVIKALAS